MNLRNRSYLAEDKNLADFYPSMYKRNKGIFYRGEGSGGKGVGGGHLGKGVYVTWHEGMAKAFASHHGQSGRVVRVKLKKGLKMLDSMSPLIIELKREIGMEMYQASSNPAVVAMITSNAKKAGYDGIVSDKIAEGIVVFDPKNMKRLKQ